MRQRCGGVRMYLEGQQARLRGPILRNINNEGAVVDPNLPVAACPCRELEGQVQM